MHSSEVLESIQHSAVAPDNQVAPGKLANSALYRMPALDGCASIALKIGPMQAFRFDQVQYSLCTCEGYLQLYEREAVAVLSAQTPALGTVYYTIIL